MKIPRYKIDELVALVHPRDGHAKVLVMIDSYLDESGIHDQAKICVIGGYFGGKGQWRKFEARWRKLLQDFRVPLAEFHAKNLMKREGFFKEWKKATQRSLLQEVAATIAKYKVHPVAFGVIVDDFRSFSLLQRRFLTGAWLDKGRLRTSGCPSKPYFMPFQQCVRRIASYAPVGGKAHFFVGLDRGFSEYAASLYRLVKSKPNAPYRERLGDLGFPMAAETPQLQAADFLVHLTYLYMLEKRETRNENLWPSDLLGTILQRLIVRSEDFVYNDREVIKGYLLGVPSSELKGEAAQLTVFKG